MLNDDDLNSSGGNNSSSNKLGLHIKSEQDPMSDPLAGVDSSFGQMNSQPGSNRPMMSQTSPERIQPLPSNIVNKSNSMDVSDFSDESIFNYKFNNLNFSLYYSTCSNKVKYLYFQRD